MGGNKFAALVPDIVFGILNEKRKFNFFLKTIFLASGISVAIKDYLYI